jgi:Domain of unknown function (DUF5666)
MMRNRMLLSCVIVPAVTGLVACSGGGSSPAAPSLTASAAPAAGVMAPARHGDSSGGGSTVDNSGPGNNTGTGDRGDDRGRDAGNNDVDAAEIVGTVMNLAGTCPALTFTIGTTKVTTNAATRFDDTTCALVANGDLVEVRGAGAPTAAGVLAARVERESDR